MKKPKKPDISNINVGRNMGFTEGVENGEIYGAYKMWKAWNKYHNWYIKSHLGQRDLCSKEIAQAIIKKNRKDK